jgi:hypothetical protein
MGFLRKIGRKIDRGIRKVFGKNGWLKAAATVAALYFVGPQAISKAIGRVGTAVKEGANFVATAGTNTPNTFTTMTDAVSKFMSEGRQFFADAAGTAAAPSNFPLKDFANSKFFGGGTDKQGNPLPKTFLPYGQELQDMGADLAKQGAASLIVAQATGGEDEFVGSTKGVQSVPMQESPSYMNQLDNFIQTSPTQLPTISLANIPPVYAKLS